MDKLKREILVIPTSKLFEVGSFEGFKKPEDFNCLDTIATHYEYRIRDLMEEDENFKQVIPYVILLCKNEILVQKRAQNHTEKRLIDKLSIGFGGHIERDDEFPTLDEILFSNVKRELFEELNFTLEKRLTPQGFLYVDQGVNKFHLAIIYIIKLDSKDQIKYNPFDTIKTLEFHEISNVDSLDGELEPWSQFLFDSYIKNLCDI